MKWMMTYEDFKVKNITQDDIIHCIQKGGCIYATIVKDLPDNDPDNPIKPVSIDDDGLITVEIDGSEYEIDIDDVEKIEY